MKKGPHCPPKYEQEHPQTPLKLRVIVSFKIHCAGVQNQNNKNTLHCYTLWLCAQNIINIYYTVATLCFNLLCVGVFCIVSFAFFGVIV